MKKLKHLCARRFRKDANARATINFDAIERGDYDERIHAPITSEFADYPRLLDIQQTRLRWLSIDANAALENIRVKTGCDDRYAYHLAYHATASLKRGRRVSKVITALGGAAVGSNQTTKPSI